MAVGVAHASPPILLNVDFAGDTPPGKVGPAVIGQSAADFWNVYLRNDGQGNWPYSQSLNNLKLADGTSTAIGLAVVNAQGGWSIPSSDVMYRDYIYPLYSGDATFTLSGVPSGLYDLYVYSADGNCEVTVGATSYGTR